MKISNFSGTAKRVVILLGIAVLAGSVGFVWMQRTDKDDSLLYLYGNVDIREVQLAFRQPGRVSTMLFDEGDAVTPGMSMATLDAQPYCDALASAGATVQVAQAELAKLRSGLQTQEVTQAQEKLKQARAVASVASSAKATLSLALEGYRAEDIAAATAHLAAAQAATALADTELLAPSNGTVIARVREPGSMVASQSTVYTLSLDKPVYVRAYVGEPNLGRIAPGTQVRVKTDSSEKAYRGQIGCISPRAEFTPKTVETIDLRTDLVYRLRIVIDEADSDSALRQGMPVTIEADAKPASGAHTKER